MDCMECTNSQCRKTMSQHQKELFLDGYKEGINDAKKQFQKQKNEKEFDWNTSIYVIEDCIKRKLIMDKGILFYTNWDDALKKQGELIQKNGCIYRVVEYSRQVS